MTRCAGSMLLTYADMSFTQFCTELFVRPHQEISHAGRITKRQ